MGRLMLDKSNEIPVVLSGWSMPESVFDSLQSYCNLLPLSLIKIAHAGSECKDNNPVTLKEMTLNLNVLLPDKPVKLIGWSLGGLLAINYAATFPAKVDSLILLGCNPCFVERNDWPFAMSKKLFKQFSEGMLKSPELTLKKFTYLCAEGAVDKKKQLRDLRTFKKTEQSISCVLQHSLLALLNQDLRDDLLKVKCPVVHCLAKDDALVPSEVQHTISSGFPEHGVLEFKGGHTFFRESPELIADYLRGEVC